MEATMAYERAQGREPEDVAAELEVVGYIVRAEAWQRYARAAGPGV